jgi:hypothetical protein
MEKKLTKHGDSLALVIDEPLLDASASMREYICRSGFVDAA